MEMERLLLMSHTSQLPKVFPKSAKPKFMRYETVITNRSTIVLQTFFRQTIYKYDSLCNLYLNSKFDFIFVLNLCFHAEFFSKQDNSLRQK